MLTDPKLRSQVDSLWDKFWSGGLNNPLDAIEQFSYLLFLKRMDDNENQREKRIHRLGQPYTPNLAQNLRWGYWTNLKADEALRHLKEVIFPDLRKLGAAGSSFERYMANAECKISKPSLLIEACKLIDQMEISQQNQDVQGDLYEYLLSKLNTAGRNGQFRTPRHIIRMMVQMLAPRPGERIGDLAGGTCGFPVNAHQYILETNTSPEILEYDEAGLPHNLIGDLLTPEQRAFMASAQYLRAFDNDAGMTMLRIGSMNLILHGIESPQFFYMDTLSKTFTDEREYDVILMNPPFKGAVDKGDVSPSLPGDTTKTELLFVHLILRALDMGGRCAVIVPDGVLFGSSNAHVNLRKKIIEDNRLDGVISMPSGVFRPYAGVSTAVLLFTRGAKTGEIWFYDMTHDGFSLDDKRVPVGENDIPDVLLCWKNRDKPAFLQERQQRLMELKAQAAPLKVERLKLHAEINRLTFEEALTPDATPFEQTLIPDRSHFEQALTPNPSNFEQALTPNPSPKNGRGESADAQNRLDNLEIHLDPREIQGELAQSQNRLAELNARIAPLQTEIDQLTRQFWVSKAQVKANKYDLSASRYRQVEADDVYYEKPEVTLERLARLEQVMGEEIKELTHMLEENHAN